jgi:secreted PhoX family phosphatase
MTNKIHRRDFLKSVGTTGLYLSAAPLVPWSLNGCASKPKTTFQDELKLIEGLQYRLLATEGDKIGGGFSFGANNDFIEWLPKDSLQSYLIVNHEHPTAYLQHGEKNPLLKTKAQVDIERASLGASLLVFEKQSGQWAMDRNSSDSFRWDATTPIPVAWGKSIRNKKTFTGTFANCAGGKTDWGTFLTCEENYDDFYGDVTFEEGRRQLKLDLADHGWERFYQEDPEQYGWVVEIDPVKKSAHKLIALGRFSHEGASFKRAANGTPVVYMGDDKEDEFLYKFVAAEKDSLQEGRLYVANLEKGKWELLSLENPKLKGQFKNHTELLISTRKAARIAGGTELDRPEDISFGLQGEIYLALTNNVPKGRPHGRILQITEEDPTALSFTSETFLEGGLQAGFSSPDNFAFDDKGFMWMTSDMGSGEVYKEFGRNALFRIGTRGDQRGQVLKVAEAPIDAEFTGPCFAPDGKSLFICVQHPGDKSNATKGFTSSWPHGNSKQRPFSGLIEISGINALK